MTAFLLVLLFLAALADVMYRDSGQRHQARQPTPGPVTPDTLFRTWAQLHDTRPGSPAEQAAWTALTTADVERRGRRY